MKTFTPEIIKHDYAIILKYDSQYELMYSMARFQEYYENEFLKSKVFSRQDLQDISPDYYIKWNGCNFPISIIKRMLEQRNEFKFDRHELTIIDICLKVDKYVIGIHKESDDSVLKHELAHARFSRCGLYNVNIKDYIEANPNIFKKVKNKLLSMGYHESVVIDEIQAYAVSGWEKLEVGKVPKRLRTLVNK